MAHKGPTRWSSTEDERSQVTAKEFGLFSGLYPNGDGYLICNTVKHLILDAPD